MTLDDDKVLRLREAKEVAWQSDKERMDLTEGRLNTLTGQAAVRLCREVYMAGYCRGRIDQLLDEDDEQ